MLIGCKTHIGYCCAHQRSNASLHMTSAHDHLYNVTSAMHILYTTAHPYHVES